MAAGSLFIVAAPSGAGKTTLVRKLLEQDSAVQLSISYTTRAPRPGEQDGREYNFVDAAQFRAMRERGDLGYPELFQSPGRDGTGQCVAPAGLKAMAGRRVRRTYVQR